MNLSLPSVALLTLSIFILNPDQAFSEELVRKEDSNWERFELDSAFRSEGAAATDVNKDGMIDVIAGDVWYEAPDWKMHEIRKPGKFVAGVGYSDSFCNFTYDINQDGWDDLIYVDEPGQPFYWYENPKNQPGHWKETVIRDNITNETPLFADITGDGKPELIFGIQPESRMIFMEIPSPEKAYEQWEYQVISRPGDPMKNGTFKYYHGLGTGDVNQDGRTDVLIVHGWWEQPEKLTNQDWEFHPYFLNKPDEKDVVRAANIHVEDLDLDGDQDLLLSCAHQYGVWWFENISEEEGPYEFEYHLIDESYSQTHALEYLDMDGDGQKDLVTGKRFFAHNGNDPGGKDEVNMFWYHVVRKKGSAPLFERHQILAGKETGVGTQFLVRDMNEDKKPDIILSNKKGVNVLLQK